MNAVLWTLLGLAVPVGSILIFIAVRSFLRRKCPGCGRWQENRPYCADCGAVLELKYPACGASCHPEAKFCPACGKPLAEPSAPAPEHGEGADAVG